MKKLLLFVLVSLISTLVYSQDNPYAIFGYKLKPQPKPRVVDIYTVINHDPKSNIKYMIVNHEDKIIKLLDDRDSVIKIMYYTDQDIFRWTSTDPMATKYPSMSPYNYGGNNPIKNIDIHGDSIRTTGSATATATYKQVAEASMGGNATMTQAANGNWTLSALTDEQALNMTGEQADAYKGYSTMISNTNTASFNLIDGNDALSHSIVVGDNGTAGTQSATPGVHTIDMGDIKALGSTGILTSAGALGHEIKEGFDIQTQHLTTPAQIMGAHRDGIRFENAINGSGRFEDLQPSPTGTARIPVVTTVNGVTTTRVITITLHNDNFNFFDINNNNKP